MSFTDYEWDEGSQHRLYALQKSYPQAIPVLGGAVFATSAARAGDMGAFVEGLMKVPSGAVFRKVPVADALEKFCEVCLVDRKLIERYIGMSFEDVAQIYS